MQIVDPPKFTCQGGDNPELDDVKLDRVDDAKTRSNAMRSQAVTKTSEARYGSSMFLLIDSKIVVGRSTLCKPEICVLIYSTFKFITRNNVEPEIWQMKQFVMSGITGKGSIP